MNISVRWLMEYLDGPAMGVDEVCDALTRAGFPIEEATSLESGDTLLDVEITSNRGDCLCHVGLAREVSAVTGRALRVPAVAGVGSGDIGFSIDIRVPELCPRFTAQLIRGVAVGPSPDWMRERLEAVGVKSINNVVDASNYVLFELGQPSHCFDLAKIEGAGFVVRMAQKGERVVALDDEEHELVEDDIVIADGSGVVSIGGVIGGKPTSVTKSTTDILVEAATWSPVHVRNTSRRHKIVTDSGHRYERIVDARAIDSARTRLVSLLLEIAGGELVDGVEDVGNEPQAQTRIALRPARCERILGIEILPERMCSHLRALDIEADPSGDTIECVVPVNRPDLVREIDLIEEVGRIEGFDSLPIHDSFGVSLRPTQRDVQGLREMSRILTGAGFYETVTVSFVTHDEATRYMPGGLDVLAVDEERRKGAPALRPSGIASLLHCRKANQDGRVERPNGLRFYETTAVFAETPDGQTIENRNLCLLADAPDAQEGLRLITGVIESLVRSLVGAGARVELAPSTPHCGVFREDGFAGVSIDGAHAGYVGVLADEECDRYDLTVGQVACEIGLGALLGGYPPKASVVRPASYPSIERDLSVVLDEGVRWEALRSAVLSSEPALLTGIEYVGTFRGKQVGAGKKSVTMRLTFQDETRTLRHEEVDPQVEAAVGALQSAVGAVLRA
ncbi:MAG: phenylalanine--tRNA ligase subunit beta [Phycisphaerales bacterium JB043]